MPGEELRRRLAAISAAASGERAFAVLRRIWEEDRWSSFDRYARSAEVCAEELEAAGLESVEVVPFPADGDTAFGDWRMPLAWDCEEATLEIVAPELPERQRLLARYTDVPSSVAMWSAPTPGEGVEGELVALEEGTPEECARRAGELRGKVALSPQHPQKIKAACADAGALGIVSYYTATPKLQNTVQWINTWADEPGGWAMHAEDRRIWGFTVSPRRGRWLRKLIAEQGPVRVRAVVRSRLYAGTLHYVTGVLPGEDAEEVLLTAHINEQGAQDNATGVSAIIEAVRVLRNMAKRGELAPPKRTIRALFFPESYGVMAYVTRERERIGRTAAAINVDGGAGRWTHVGTNVDVYRSLPSCANATDALVCAVVREMFAQWDAAERVEAKRYTLSGDNFLCEPLLGVPNPWLEVGSGERVWHNSADVPERVDPLTLGRAAATIAAFADAVARFGADEAELASEELMRQASRTAGELLLAAARAEEPPQVSFREQAALLAQRTRAAFSALEKQLSGAQAAREKIRRAGTSVSKMLRDLAASFPDGARGTPPLGALGRRYPRRTVVGALTLDGIPREQWRVVRSSPRWWSPALWAWWLATGERTVDEIARLVAVEFRQCPEWLGEFFEFLADFKLVDLRESATRPTR